jgi:proline iminopeptidase
MTLLKVMVIEGRGRYLHCPSGSHMAMYDDQDRYFGGITDFLTTLPAG